MKQILLLPLLALSILGIAQTDTTPANDILNKLKKLEELKAKNSEINPVKVITDSSYAKKVTGENKNDAPIATKPVVKVKPIETRDKVVPKKHIVEVDTNILQPIIVFDTAAYDLGSVEQGKIVKQKFTFTNKGTDDLELINVVPDCSCTSPEWSTEKIKPGQKGYVIATYDSTEDIGKFLKTITVLHNSGDGWTFLEIRGYVAPKL
jgi:hypothetical protein